MAALLPSPLICLTIRHVIDDPAAVEGLLAENPEAAKCFPLALKEVLNMPTIPDASATYRHLTTLWDPQFVNGTAGLDPTRALEANTPAYFNSYSAYIRAARNGATYLLDYVNEKPDDQMVYFAMEAAVNADEVDTLVYLLDKFHGANALVPTDILNRAVSSGAVKSVKAILDRGIADYNTIEYTLSEDLSPNMDSLRLLLEKLPRNDKVKDGINEALVRYTEQVNPLAYVLVDQHGNAFDQAGRTYNVQERNNAVIKALRLLLENGAQATDVLTAAINRGSVDDIFMDARIYG